MSMRTRLVIGALLVACIVAGYALGRVVTYAKTEPRMVRLESQIAALENEAAHLQELCAQCER